MIRAIIADDEQPARGRLKKFLDDYQGIELVAEAENGQETVEQVNRLKPDLLFLDIQMPKGNGFEALAQFTHEPIVVFTTAYDEYAIEAFDVHAQDYLLKPFSKDRFEQTIQRVRARLGDPEEYKAGTRTIVSEINPVQGVLKRVSVKKGHVFTILPTEAILAITTIDGLVYIHTADNEFQSDTTLNQFERRLDPSLFMRIHRSSIVNLERITKIMPWGQGRYAVVLENGNSLQVSRERIKEFRERVGLKI